MTLPHILMLTGAAVIAALLLESVWHGCTYRN